jgi:anthranilate synthase/aminodeoxychorismate synthase-like glutamine amidotransferase
MILVIDNYDSFTYNLVQYLGELGTKPFVRRNNEITLDEIAALAPTQIVISPGPGRPEQAGITLDVIKRFGPTIPLLGVCLGHQAIGMAFGGSVVRAVAPMHGKTSTIKHDGRGVFAGIASPLPSRAITRSWCRKTGCRTTGSVRADRGRRHGDGAASRRIRFTAQFHPSRS